jgi:hypothetical protein
VSKPGQQLVRNSTRRVELGGRTFGERNRDDFARVRPVGIVAEVWAAIGLKGERDAVAILHYQVRILPVAVQFNPGTTPAAEPLIRPAVHPKMYGFAIS